MRMPRFLFTIRRIMVVVAIVAICLLYGRFAWEAYREWESRQGPWIPGMAAQSGNFWIAFALPYSIGPICLVLFASLVRWHLSRKIESRIAR